MMIGAAVNKGNVGSSAFRSHGTAIRIESFFHLKK